MLDDIKDFLEEYWILVWMVVVLIGFVIWLFVPRDYTLDVNQIQWEYVVHIEEFMVRHHDDDSSKPSDAYNVESHYHPHTKTWTDEDGNTHTKDDSYWTYDYDVNRWVETRQVVTTDYDHNPYFGEYEALLSKLPQQKAYVVNTIIFCGARLGDIAKVGAKVTNRDIEAWAFYIKNHSLPCLFVTVEED